MAHPSRTRATRLALIACGIALVPLATRALWWLPAFQQRRVARLSLTELAALTRAEPDNVSALLAYGRLLNQAGRYDEALVPLQNAAGLEPDDGRIREAWSAAQVAGGYVTGAFGQLTQFVRTHPDDADGRRALGRFYNTQRSYNRAVDELSAATRAAPNDADAWALLGAARRGLGETESAWDALRRAVALKPDGAVETLQFATLCLETNRTDEALSRFARAADLAPHDPVVAAEWARALLQTGRADRIGQALPLARSAAESAPDDPGILYLLGRVQLAAGDPESARRTLEKAARSIPPGTPVSTLPANEPTQFLDPAPALEASQACLALNRRDDARRWRQIYARRLSFRDEWQRRVDGVRQSPGRQSYLRLADLLARRGDDAEVARYLAQARGDAADAPPVLAATARLLCREGYAERAVGVARRAVLLAPRGPETHEALGTAQLAAGRGHEAAVAFAHAAGFLPAREPQYRAQLDAFYRRRSQHPTEAQRLYARARALERVTFGLPVGGDTLKGLLVRAAAADPLDTDILRLLLKTHYRRGERDEALKVAEQLLALSPEDALGLSLRATLLLESPGANADRDLLRRDLARALREERLAAVYYAQGVLTLQTGTPKDALPILLQALELAREPRTYARLIETYDALGDSAKAAAARRERDALVADEVGATTRLLAIVDQPQNRAAYQAAAQYFRSHGQNERAAILEATLPQTNVAAPRKSPR